MAKAKQTEEPKDKKPARKVVRKKEQTVRERAATNASGRPKRIRRTAGRVSAPVKKLNPLKGRKYKGVHIRGRRIRFIPLFLVNAWKEIRQVTWPNWRETWRLTIAVFIFAVIFAAFVGILDYGLGKLFKEVIINR